MPKLIDLTNQRFGKLVVIKRGENSKQNKPQWICKCDCGNEYLVRGESLRSGKTTQCKSCQKKQAGQTRTKNLDNKILNSKFGYLTPIKIDDTKERGAGKAKYWFCECDCGNTVSLTSHQLLGGLQITCGNQCEYHKKEISQRQIKDLTNQVFGNLTVVERDFSKNHSGRTSQWKCICKCGNQVIASRASLINGTRQCCNLCLNGKSIGEKNIEFILRENNIKFQSEVSFSDLKGVNGGYPRFDFVLYNDLNTIIRIIEFDGEFHYMNIDTWNSETVKENDIIKNNYCNKNNIPLVRIPYWERDKITLDMIMGDQYLCEIGK